jgi:hypothetical protein
MKRVHPNMRHGAVAALALLMGVTGCRSQQGGIPNPFLAPNRVPPPATRAILPGQAQPYYPGDPLPVMQSGTPQSMGAIAANASAPQAIPSADTALAWGSPSKTPVAVSQPESRVLAAANEPTVTIPNDTGALRFDLPAGTVPAQSVASMASSHATGPLPTTSRSGMSSVADQGVVQASYNQPIANSVKPGASEQPAYSITQAPTSPWRSPQISSPPALSAWAPTLQQMPLPPPPSWVPNPVPYGSYAGSQNVQLRAVASPSAPGEAVPRIRFPGYTATAQNTSAADGFRPRSSMR